MESLKRNIGIAVEILKINQEYRGHKDIEALATATRHVRFFQELIEKEKSNHLHLECCKKLSYLEVPSGNFVFHKGDVGTAMYIVIEGEVRVMLPQNPDPAPSESGSGDKSNFYRRANTLLAESFVSVDLIEVATMCAGQCFGEMALMNDRFRTASIQCKTDCKLAVLSKENYKIVSGSIKRHFNERTRFLESIPYFESWTKVALQRLSMNTQALNLKKGQFVFREGDLASEVFILKSGAVTIMRDFKLPIQQLEIYSQMKTKRKFKRKTLEIVIKQEKQLFGFEELMSYVGPRRNSCMCSSLTAEILVLTEGEFFKNTRNVVTRELLDSHSILLLNWEEERLAILKNMEVVKNRLSFTQKEELALTRKTYRAPQRKEFVSPVKKTFRLPAVASSMSRAPSMHLKTLNEAYSGYCSAKVFYTELPEETSRLSKNASKMVNLQKYILPIKLGHSMMSYKRPFSERF